MNKNKRNTMKRIAKNLKTVSNHRKPKTENYHVITSFETTLTELGLIYATFTCNGKAMNFILDTGSNLSYVDAAAISEMDLELHKCNDSVMGLGGSQDMGYYCSLKLETPETVTVIDLPINDFSGPFGAVERENGVRLHGLLGNNFLLASKYVIDYEKMKVLKPKSKPVR
jgi:hypothetical protein